MSAISNSTVALNMPTHPIQTNSHEAPNAFIYIAPGLGAEAEGGVGKLEVSECSPEPHNERRRFAARDHFEWNGTEAITIFSQHRSPKTSNSHHLHEDCVCVCVLNSLIANIQTSQLSPILLCNNAPLPKSKD